MYRLSYGCEWVALFPPRYQLINRLHYLDRLGKLFRHLLAEWFVHDLVLERGVNLGPTLIPGFGIPLFAKRITHFKKVATKPAHQNTIHRPAFPLQSQP